MNCLKGLCLRPTQNGHIVPHNLTRKGPREFVPPGSFFVVPSGIRPGLAGVFQLSAPFLEVSGRGEGDMGELQNQWHKCRVFVGMKTADSLHPVQSGHIVLHHMSEKSPEDWFLRALCLHSPLVPVPWDHAEKGLERYGKIWYTKNKCSTKEAPLP